METFFTDAIATLLEQVEKKPDRPVEDIVKDISQDLGMDARDLELISNASSVIDRTTEKVLELNKFRDAGGTREGFIESELDRMTENMTEEEAKAVREAYQKTMEGAGIQTSEEE